jgi:hypothetical protein
MRQRHETAPTSTGQEILNEALRQILEMEAAKCKSRVFSQAAENK